MNDVQLRKTIASHRYWVTSFAMYVYVRKRRYKELTADYRQLRAMERSARRRRITLSSWKNRASVESVIAERPDVHAALGCRKTVGKKEFV